MGLQRQVRFVHDDNIGLGWWVVSDSTTVEQSCKKLFRIWLSAVGVEMYSRMVKNGIPAEMIVRDVDDSGAEINSYGPFEVKAEVSFKVTGLRGGD